MWALSYFYAGANDASSPTCFVNNSPLCSVCENSKLICQESIDIKEHLILLFSAVRALCSAGLEGVTKTLLTAVLLGSNEKYV